MTFADSSREIAELSNDIIRKSFNLGLTSAVININDRIDLKQFVLVSSAILLFNDVQSMGEEIDGLMLSSHQSFGIRIDTQLWDWIVFGGFLLDE